MKTPNTISHWIVSKQDLPFYCPVPNSDIAHPKVFLDFSKSSSAICPYCSMNYVLKNDKKSTNE